MRARWVTLCSLSTAAVVHSLAPRSHCVGEVVGVARQLVATLIPPRTAPLASRMPAGVSLSRLPVPEIPFAAREGSLRYGMGRIDASGRVSDKSMLAALGWRIGQCLTIAAIGTAAVVHPDPDGLFLVPGSRYVVLPAPVRRRCGFSRGDRVFLAADPVHGVLVIHPTSALDTMLATYHASLLVGDRDEQPEQR